jgi:ABC-2 type transport system permease protein
MPPVMQWAGYVIPLTYFLEILRGIVLRGAGFDELWQPVAAMLVLATVLLVAASIRFARRAAS